MNAQELPARFNEQRVRAHIAESHANFERLRRASAGFIPGHEGEWVASHGGEFVFGATLKDVLNNARRAGWPLDVVAVDHLSRSGPPVLL